MLREACAKARHINELDGGAGPLKVSINLSGRQLQEPRAVRETCAVVEESGADPSTIVFEITESILISDVEQMVERLVQRKLFGVGLAVDDFGTGHSSPSYLRRFPIDTLKFDKTFVDGLGRPGAADGALGRAIVCLGQTMGMATVAEGIESERQAEALCALGCDEGQGFHLARPLTEAALDDLLDGRTELASAV